MPGPAVPVEKAPGRVFDDAYVNRIPWDAPEPEPTEPPDEKMLPLTMRLPVR